MSNTEIVKGMYEAFNRGEIGTVLNSLTDNVEWIVPGGSDIPFSGRYTGRSAVAGFFHKLVETTESDAMVVERYVEQGDMVIALGTSSGRSKPLQKPFSTSFAMAFTLQGGKVARFQEYTDMTTVASSFTTGSQAARS